MPIRIEKVPSLGDWKSIPSVYRYLLILLMLSNNYTANIYHPAIDKLQQKADKVREKIYNLMIKGI